MTNAAIVPSPSVRARAVCLLERRSEWRTIRVNGARRVVIESDSGRVYFVDPDGRACSCRAGQVGTYCAHRLAVSESAHHEALAAWLDDLAANPPAPAPKPAPKPRKSYAALFAACGVDACDEDAGRSGYCLEHARCSVCREPSLPGLGYASCADHELVDAF